MNISRIVNLAQLFCVRTFPKETSIAGGREGGKEGRREGGKEGRREGVRVAEERE